MSKKLLACFLAILIALSACVVVAFADNDWEYRYWGPDQDFTTLVTMDKGNNVATLLQPGDRIFFKFGTSNTLDARGLDVVYYPDADSVSKTGNWNPVNSSLLAFSIAGAANVTDTLPRVANQTEKTYTVKDLGETVTSGTVNADIDFTIAYPEDNSFLGWVVHSYATGGTAGTASAKFTVRLYAVWDKQRIPTPPAGGDDFEDILNINATRFGKFMAPIMEALKKWNNAVANFLQGTYDNQVGNEPMEPEELGGWQAFMKGISRSLDIVFTWMDTWANPIYTFFQNLKPAGPPVVEEPTTEPTTQQAP